MFAVGLEVRAPALCLGVRLWSELMGGWVGDVLVLSPTAGNRRETGGVAGGTVAPKQDGAVCSCRLFFSVCASNRYNTIALQSIERNRRCRESSS